MHRLRALNQFLRNTVPQPVRFELRQTVVRSRMMASAFRFWEWELVGLKSKVGAPYGLAYLGSSRCRGVAQDILGTREATPVRFHLRSPDLALASEIPWRGALKVPRSVHMIVALDRSIDEILAGYDRSLRRKLRKHQPEYTRRQISSDSEIDRLCRDMLFPYAAARHGDRAFHYSSDQIRRMAKEYGRLDLTCRGDAEIGCRLGCGHTFHGKRYWIERWFGYPESIYSDPVALREANAMNSFVSIVWAKEHGYDYYDMGACYPHPEDGNLQWKRRRGGAVDLLENFGFCYVRPPRRNRARFFWDVPIFAVEGGALTLHLGLPTDIALDEARDRFRELRFAGLARTYLHCDAPPDDATLEALRGPMAGRDESTPLEVVRCDGGR